MIIGIKVGRVIIFFQYIVYNYAHLISVQYPILRDLIVQNAVRIFMDIQEIIHMIMSKTHLLTLFHYYLLLTFLLTF